MELGKALGHKSDEEQLRELWGDLSWSKGGSGEPFWFSTTP